MKVIDRERLADTIKAAHPSGVTFNNVRTMFTERVKDKTMETGKFITVSMESTAEITKNDKRNIAKAMDDYMMDSLGMKADASNNAYRIYYQDTPLTVPIADKGRADLAWNMLRAMAKNDHPVRAKIKGNNVTLFPDGLSIKDKNGNEVEPELDLEWFGSPDDNDKAREAALDKDIQEGLNNGMLHPDYYSREMEASLQEQYSVCSFDDDKCRLWFAPNVWDVDKAGEMQNFMTYGVDPQVKLYAWQGGKYDKIKEAITQIIEARKQAEVFADMDFADAVASISQDGEALNSKY